MARVAFLSALLLTVALLVAPAPTAFPGPIVSGTPAAMVVYPLPFRTTAAQTSWDLEVTMLNLINNERVAAGLAPLMPHATIRGVARGCAQAARTSPTPRISGKPTRR